MKILAISMLFAVSLFATGCGGQKDGVSLKWWYFPVGTYEGELSVDDPSSARTTFTVPADALPGQTIHFVLQASDNGTPQLVKYLRTVITVE